MPRQKLELGTAGRITVNGYVADGVKSSGATKYRRAIDGETPIIWRATCRYRGSNGRTRQTEVWDQTKGRATTRLRNKIAELTSNVLPQTKVTFEVAASQWQQHLNTKVTDGKLRQQTLDQYQDMLQRLLVPALGGFEMTELTTGLITDTLNGFAADGISRAKSSRVVLKQICDFAKQHDWIERDIMQGVPSYSSPAKPIRVLTVEEVRQVRAAVRAWCGGNQYGPPRGEGTLDVLDFMLATGVRTGEALAVRWEDVDLGTPEGVDEDGNITVATPPTLTVSGTARDSKRQDRTKTDAGYREIVLPNNIVDMLLHRASVATSAVYVFPARGGGLRSPANFRRCLRSALEAAGIEDFIPYLLRKLNATTIGDAVSLEAASRNLGHSDTKVTAKYYASRPSLAPDVSTVTGSLLDQVRF